MLNFQMNDMTTAKESYIVKAHGLAASGIKAVSAISVLIRTCFRLTSHFSRSCHCVTAGGSTSSKSELCFERVHVKSCREEEEFDDV
jgi:hypothetical protein